ncbi:Uncharacterized protein YjbK [Mesobacillus persicus]|uniref:Uncharacterized protein YjbK n=1 Tax=Mesobacillus persicus TaxID=930146 RepID=A0A1H8E7H2_9BACI|nr:CYTH domain-containing protein [Mesobacillus persicus]SEN15360.1 Uncharacterized protein YjbK [Mesobacillus persicus]
MSQHIEIEFKNLLTQEEFFKLSSYFTFKPEDFRKQVNHYFDTPSFTLKSHGCALRIREKAGTFELTLKQPANTGLLETNQTISIEQVQAVMKTGTIPSGIVYSALENIIQDSDSITYFGTLSTERAEKNYKAGLIVLDHSTYLSTEDFEIEYEVTDANLGQEVFKSLLKQMHIPLRKTDNKIMRFYNQKQLELDSK